MVTGFQQEEFFLWDLKRSQAEQLKSQMGISSEGLPVIFSLWPLMDYFSTCLLKWSVTLDYMKLLPHKAGIKYYSDLSINDEVRFEVEWSAIPSLEVPMPRCDAKVLQAGQCRAELSIEFLQRPPRDKPKPFDFYATQKTTSVPWAKDAEMVSMYLSAVGLEDPIFSSHEFAVAMGMVRPLIPDLYLLFRLWQAFQSEEQELREFEVCFAQPALSQSELFLHQNIDGKRAHGFLCDDMQRPIFSDFIIQWEKAGASWPAN